MLDNETVSRFVPLFPGNGGGRARKREKNEGESRMVDRTSERALHRAARRRNTERETERERKYELSLGTHRVLRVLEVEWPPTTKHGQLNRSVVKLPL